MNCIFAHGFEGSPHGNKPQLLKRLLGGEVFAPAMHQRGWSFEAHVEVVMEQLDAHPDVQLLAGSSMGAFASAVAATRWPNRSLKLLLFAPACGVHRSWAAAQGEDGMAIWKSEGVLRHFHHGVNGEIEIPYAFWQQCAQHADVVIQHPTVIVHGLHDEIIPIAEAEALSQRSPGVHRLFAVDDSHRLQHSAGAMEEALNCLLSL